MKKVGIKILLCLTAIIFAVSCAKKNECPTCPIVPDPTPTELSIIENSSLLGTDHHFIKADVDSTDSYMKKSASYLFVISPADENCSVMISDVSVSPTSPVQNVSLSKEDFELTKTIEKGVQITLEVSLTQTGIDKLKQAAVEKLKR